MCNRKSWIKNVYNGHSYFVNCGHCEACKQEKAIKRTNRIRANKKDVGIPDDVLFVGLTYSNRYVPYISRTDVKAYLSGFHDKISIYRDYAIRKVSTFKSGFRVISQRLYGNDRVLDTFEPELSHRESYLKPVHHLLGLRTKLGEDNFVSDIWRIGVPYLPDIQNFIKRFKVNFFRNHGYEGELSYFYVCELGSESLRPHFHLLIYVEHGWFDKASKCVRESWPYGIFTKKSIQRAIHPEGYISSYVNSDATISDFLRDISRFNTFHHYSKNFGFGKSNFSFRALYDSFESGDFGYDETRVKEGVLTRTTCTIPVYVVNKYFRKFKGFGRLTSDEIFRIAKCPDDIREFKYIIDAEDSELRTISVSLKNLKQLYVNKVASEYKKDVKVDFLPFEFVYSRIWQRYNSFKLRMMHKDKDTDIDVLQLYDNLADCFYFNVDGKPKGFIRNDLIRRIAYGNICYWPFPSDPNDFTDNLNRTHSLELAYASYAKDKRKRNHIYSHLNSQF